MVKLKSSTSKISVLIGFLVIMYGASFLIVSRTWAELGNLISPLILLIFGLLSIIILVELYLRLKNLMADTSLLAFSLGLLGALGAIVHGGYDLANAVNAPSATPAFYATIPNPLDPMGLLSIGITGVSIVLWANLLMRAKSAPSKLALIGYGLGTSLIFLYFLRLLIPSPTHPLLAVTAIWIAFLMYPLWYFYLGFSYLDRSK